MLLFLGELSISKSLGSKMVCLAETMLLTTPCALNSLRGKK